MSVIGDFTVPSSAFALEQALSTVPEVSVEADRLASHSPEEVFPFLWARDGDPERFRRALADDPTVSDVDVADETDGETLYRLEWDDRFHDLVHEMVDHHAAILEATARDDRWDLRLRFAREGMVSDFQDHFRERGRRFEVNRLSNPTEPRQLAFGLTEEQHEALVTAATEGYFSVPRTASAAEVSEALSISANAFSERIRRGSETLVRSTILGPGDGE